MERCLLFLSLLLVLGFENGVLCSSHEDCDCQKTSQAFGTDLLEFFNLITDSTYAWCGTSFGNYDRRPVLRWMLAAFEDLEKKFEAPCEFVFEVPAFSSDCEMLVEATSRFQKHAETVAAYAGTLCDCGCGIPDKDRAVLRELLANTRKFLAQQLKKMNA
ncbi:hypothetical protein QR680_008946 [Steinernema hermaphroditum]|uniref:Uncharacterized protein n=1 Tax=Steinernema hermaphroditum TaxID=289476 RepID=A0AA39IKY6_9BILA|nr:hypothetical protein QR680_008946 [Steinernema hermaphroditum]